MTGKLLDEFGIDNPFKYSDKELLDMEGLGPATLEKIRDMEVVSTKFLHLGGGYNVAPGDVIPEEYDPAKYVKRGQAEWR